MVVFCSSVSVPTIGIIGNSVGTGGITTSNIFFSSKGLLPINSSTSDLCKTSLSSNSLANFSTSGLYSRNKASVL